MLVRRFGLKEEGVLRGPETVFKPSICTEGHELSACVSDQMALYRMCVFARPSVYLFVPLCVQVDCKLVMSKG